MNLASPIYWVSKSGSRLTRVGLNLLQEEIGPVQGAVAARPGIGYRTVVGMAEKVLIPPKKAAAFVSSLRTSL